MSTLAENTQPAPSTANHSRASSGLDSRFTEDSSSTGIPASAAVPNETDSERTTPAVAADLEKGQRNNQNLPVMVGIRPISDPMPLGLLAVASTTLLFSFCRVGMRGIDNLNIVLGMGLACSGLAQLLAGMWSFAVGDTFGATAFSAYGAFWMSYSLQFIPFINADASYVGSDTADQENDALGVFLTIWFIMTFIFCVGALRMTIPLFLTFFFLDCTFLLLMIAAYLESHALELAGGWVGIVTSFMGLYAGAVAINTRENSVVRLWSPNMPQWGRKAD